jgi:hypothetical protein
MQIPRTIPYIRCATFFHVFSNLFTNNPIIRLYIIVVAVAVVAVSEIVK